MHIYIYVRPLNIASYDSVYSSILTVRYFRHAEDKETGDELMNGDRSNSSKEFSEAMKLEDEIK